MQKNILRRFACVFTALVSTTDALRATRRQCCNFVAATAALAADKACAVDSNALEDAFSARTKVLRSVPCGNQPVRRLHRAVEQASHRWRGRRRIILRRSAAIRHLRRADAGMATRRLDRRGVALRRREFPAVGLVLSKRRIHSDHCRREAWHDPSHTERRRRAERICTVIRLDARDVFGCHERGGDAQGLLVRRHGHPSGAAERQAHDCELQSTDGQARSAPAADRSRSSGLCI